MYMCMSYDEASLEIDRESLPSPERVSSSQAAEAFLLNLLGRRAQEPALAKASQDVAC